MQRSCLQELIAITLENHLLFPNSERLFSGMGSPCHDVPQAGQLAMSAKEVMGHD
jgi:hypothetical protein